MGRKKKDNEKLGEEENVTRLIKHKKRGLLRIVFGRVGLMLVLLFVQLVMVTLVYHWLEEVIGWLSISVGIFLLLMIIYLFDCEMDYSAKLTWLWMMMLFPLPCSILLFIVRRDIGHGKIKNMVEFLIAQTRDKLPYDKEIMERPEIKASCTDGLCRYAAKSGCFPLYANTDVKFLSLGEYKFEAMLTELEKAEKFIFMEYFIIDEGYMWGRVLNILAKKAQQGVDVRVMYDGMCEISLLPHDYPKRMEKLGIKCKAFSPIMPFVSTHYNYRDHRKILVIDGKTAFNGGVNLADEYINRASRFGHWKDTAVMLKGEAVVSFTLMFLQMWNATEKERQWEEFLQPSPPVQANGYVMPYADCPLDDEKLGECVYMDILNRASRYVHIMTPYLILDGELEAALIFAAERGVDVRIILPGIPDKKAAFALAKTHYKRLIRSGIKIYEYTPGFVHAKVFVADDEKAVIGTINLDYRSLYHHFECATYMYRTDCIADIEKDYLETVEKCLRITPETISKEKFSYKVAGAFLKVLAPLM